MAYIDADKVIDELMKKQSDDIAEQLGIYEAVVMLYRALAVETADVAEVKHGEWVLFYNEYGFYRCSECDNCYGDPSWKFCPFCGAKMDGGSD